MVIITDWLTARLTAACRASYMGLLLIWCDLIPNPTWWNKVRGSKQTSTFTAKTWQKMHRQSVGPKWSYRRGLPPPAYCVSPGFFINRSTEEGRADREVVLREGVGFNRQAQRDPLNKYMIKKTHQQAAQYLPPPGWQFTSNFSLQFSHCRGILPPTLTVKRAQEGGDEKQDRTEEKNSLGEFVREGEREGFSCTVIYFL